MFDQLVHAMPLAVSAASILASIAIVLIGHRFGARGVRRALAPALFLGMHGAVGLVLFAGRALEVPRSQIGPIAASLDALSVLLLAWMLADAAAAITEVRAVVRTSRIREAEYERARRDYETLMRHRIANPLLVVSGGISTLNSLDERVPAVDRSALLDAMADAADQIERIALDPEPVSAEEHGLLGRPRRSTITTHHSAIVRRTMTA